jgi:hypothetical protein
MTSEVIYNLIAMLRAERGISRRELTDALGVHYETRPKPPVESVVAGRDQNRRVASPVRRGPSW